MVRRVHVEAVRVGTVPLSADQAHHVRAVLRLAAGTVVVVFDDAGNVAAGPLDFAGEGATVRVDAVVPAGTGGLSIVVAAAVPKGDRADWMVEKLSEVGVARFVPVAAGRSVVLPTGRGKHDRWERIATEAAKQCRRAGVMRVDPLTPVAAVVAAVARGWYLSTAPDATPAAAATSGLPPAGEVTLLIGPEGGWTDAEVAAFAAAGLVGVKLTNTVLRTETAAVLAAGWVAAWRA